MSLYTSTTYPTAPPDISEVTANEVLDLHEVLTRMNAVPGNDDAIIYSQIQAVRYALERRYNMSFCEEKTVTAYYEYVGDRIELPLPPVISVDNVYIVDSEGVETETTGYYVFGNSAKYIKVNDTSGGVKVVYTTGLTDGGLKEILKDALLSEVMMWYYQRGQGTEVNYRIGDIAAAKLGMIKKL